MTGSPRATDKPIPAGSGRAVPGTSRRATVATCVPAVGEIGPNPLPRLARSAAEVLQQCRLDDLDPVPIRILDEGHVAHLALLWTLHIGHFILVKPGDRGS